VYGNSSVKLKFYGPWGEERFKEQQINVPFNFLPPGEVEYTLNAGLVEDGEQSVFSRGEVHYGLSRAITIGSGIEFLSSVVSGPIMPFLSLATRLFSNILLSADYTYGVRGRGMFTIQLPKNSQLELNYIKYQPGQKAVNYNYLEERKVTLTLPLKARNISMFNRLTYGQIVLPGTGYSTAEWLISGAIYGVSTNLSNYAMFTNSVKPYIYSNLSMSFRLPKGIMFLPQAQYEFSNKELISVKAGLEKYLFRNGFVSLSYENNFKSNVQSAQFAFRYDLPFAQTGFTARQTNEQTTIMEMARGSLIFDPKTNYMAANSKVNVGRGGIVFAPFLDLNCNNRRDNGEPRADGLDIRINGGTSTYNEKDTTVRVTDLEPYTSYLVELDANSFDNVAWKIRNKVLKIVVDPNSFKLVNIPVAVVGEVSGIVYKENGEEQEGLGRITINIFNSKSQLTGKTLSEPDGYYSYLGLAPGVYDVSVDSVQLRKLHLQATPEKQSITILKSQDGDIVEGIDFTLKSTRSAVVDTLDNDSNIPKSDLTIPVQQQALSTQNAQSNQAIASQNIPQKQVIPNPNNQVQQQAVSSQKIQPSQAITSQNIPPKQVIANPSIPVQQKTVSNQNEQPSQASTGQNIPPKQVVSNPAIPVPQQVIPKPDISMNQANTNQNIPPKQVVSNPTIPVQQQVIPKPDISLNQTSANQNIPPKQVVSNPTIPVQQQVIPKPDISLNQASDKQNIPPKQIISNPIIQPQRIIEDQNKGRQMGQTFLQVGAFKGINNARRLSEILGKTINYPIEVAHENGWYKVRFGAFSDSRTADLCRTEILANGIISADQIKEINLQGSLATANNQVSTLASAPAKEQVIQVDPILPAKVVVPVTQPTMEQSVIDAPEVQSPAEKNIARSDKYLQKHYFVQVGAFAIPKNATRMKKNIAPLVEYAVEIVFRDQLYKVRFGPFETQVELNNCIRQVVQSGIMTRELMKIYYEEIGSTPLVDQPHVMTGFHIQVGAFKDKINATKFYQKMSGEFAFPALIAEEDGYYKVRFGPFKSLSETKKYSKELEKNRVDCFIRNNTVNYF
jgi:cell division protein FtsN